MNKINWLQEVEKRKDSILEDLKKILSINSVLDNETISDSTPFGEGVNQALNFVLDLGKKDGFITKNVDGYAGHVEYGDGNELIGVLSHIDVVPVGEGWTSDPFVPEVREGNLYARGALDDKGPTIAAYYALLIVKELGLKLNNKVRLIVGTDEETQWRCMDRYFASEKMPDMGFTPDANFPIIIGEKGLLDLEISKKHDLALKFNSDSWKLESFISGQRSNMVPEKASARLLGDLDVFDLKEEVQQFLQDNAIEGFAQEFDEGVELVFKGVAAHGSAPQDGKNAALDLARFLQTITLDERGKQFINFLNLTLDSFGEKLGIEISDEQTGRLTLNPGIFEYNNETIKLIVNIRYPISTSKEDVIDKISSKITNFGYNAKEISHHRAIYCDPEHKLIKTLANAYETQTGTHAELLSIGGATYAKALDVGVAFGPLFPGDSECYHAKDEFINLENLFKATAIYAQAIYDLAK